ncbi:MAG: peptidyl-prolyl cis-trans isomerase [Caulobacteraceae bacterium]|nr:peptidyl-prolyl cis-trans isomerase [Caulobacteraceae bacterium]
MLKPAQDRPPKSDGLFDLSRLNLKRSFVLAGAGALTGLILAGFSLFTAKGTAIHLLPPEDVALVDNQPVLMSDFIAQVEASYGIPFAQATDAQKLKTLNDMIREELYVQRGLELGMPSSDPDTRNALVAAVEQQVVADVTSENPTDAQLKAYFERHRDRYADEGTITVTDLAATGPGALGRARAAAADIAAGVPPAEAAARHGLKDSGKTSGKEFYFAARLHLGEALFDVARRLAAGRVSSPIAGPDGAHLLAVAQNKPPTPMSFAEAQPKVFADYKSEAEARLQAGDEKYLRGKADIIVDRVYRR